MVRYELLLISRKFQHPRQFELVMSGRVSGEQLAGLLEQQFPGQQWYSGTCRLEELELLPASERLLLSELPQPVRSAPTATSCLKLYIRRGPDAGAWIALSKGEHLIGRTAPLWLEDPLVSRIHAKLSVTTRGLHLSACANQQIAMPDGSRYESVDLEQGSRFILGHTEFAIGDPLVEGSSISVSPDQLEIQAPPKPEMARLIALVLAAFVPILSGILLALVTGSMLFLILSGVSALMGVVPAGQLLIERRQWKREVKAQRAAAIAARKNYAPELGEYFVSELDSASLGRPCAQVPPLVWGEGLWSPQDIAPSAPKGIRKVFRSLKKPKSDAPWYGPVFFPSTTGIWQLKTTQGQYAGSILASVLARYLPAIHAGRIRLVIDPSIRCLPSSLLLMRHVSSAQLVAPEESRHFGNEDNALSTIYVTAQAPQPVPGALVLGIWPATAECAENWITPHPVSAHLPDERLALQNLSPLSLARFDKMVHQLVALQKRSITSHLDSTQEPTLAVRAHLGMSDQGEEVFLDLHEDGPHVLICGTTGSGKSEALRRIISDFARNYSPAQLAFALIDFKGGAGLSVYESLPHVQLFASDLDEAAAERTLEQLEHEVRRREELLASHGCSDIAEYQALDESEQVLPRLLVVVDEFRVFIETLPQANLRIDRLAAVGRALGIHLILSTQRPAGALTGQTRANLNTTIALRVNDQSESVELVGSTAASKLIEPGQAIVKSATKPTRNMQCSLAIEPPLHGELFERNRHDLSLMSLCRFEKAFVPMASDPLRAHAAELASKWESTVRPVSGFAQPLPLPEESAQPPETWEGIERGALYCGVVDNLHRARLEPLVIDRARSRSILICGLPEAGASELFASLANSPRKILCFGPAPIQGTTGNLRVVTGEDLYSFLDAVDFLESMPQDPSLIIIVHSLAQLQSNIHPQHFQRLDEALGSLLRFGGAGSPLVLCAVDRDQNTLKSTGLCTEQWFFPFNATESLRMIWPKIPTCSPLPGRGVRISSGHPPQVFQLTRVQAAEAASSTWLQLTPSDDATLGAGTEPQNLLGYAPFDGAVVSRPMSQCVILLCPDVQQRLRISVALAQRWNGLQLSGLADLENFVRTLREGPNSAREKLLCLFLEATNDSRLPSLLEVLRSAGLNVVLCVPPSSRLAFDLGMSSVGLDDRQVVVVEATHPQDLQPMNWPAIPQGSSAHSGDYWRAIISKHGKPRMIHIPHNLAQSPLAVRPVPEESRGIWREEHHYGGSGNHDGQYRHGRHHRDIRAEERD